VVALRELEREETVPPGSKFETFAYLDRLLGLDLARDVGRPASGLPPGAQPLLDARAAARAAKDWSTSDQLRAELAELGVSVVDTPQGQQWTVS
jgi:cysteinyl-tRNA synthetase